jgi:hypothetical protein
MGILFFSPLDQIKSSAGRPLLSKANFNSSFVQEVLNKSSSSGPNSPPPPQKKKKNHPCGVFFFWVLQIPLQNNKLLHLLQLPGSAAASTASC